MQRKIQGSGVGGRITREDIAREVAKRDAQKAKQDVATEQNTISTVAYSSRSEKRVPMTRYVTYCGTFIGSEKYHRNAHYIQWSGYAADYEIT